MLGIKELHLQGRQSRQKPVGSNGKSATEIQRMGCLPESSVEFICQLCERKPTQINLHLSQNRFRVETEDKKTGKFRESPLLAEIIKKQGKTKHAIPSQNLYDSRAEELLEQLLARNQKMTGYYSESGEYCFHIADKTILGEGNSAYSEYVLMKLHPLYGVPYLPASTIKGILRSCWNTLFERGEQDGKDEKSIEQQLFEEGHQKLIFFDAYPQSFSLALDIQSPHYKDYYEQQSAPTDSQKVIPITFICLKNVRFKIHIACQDAALWKQEKARVDEAVKCMVETYGIGAKTALGYGIGEMK